MNNELQIADDIEIVRYLAKKANEHDPKLKNKDIADAFQEYDGHIGNDTAKNIVSKLMSEKNNNLRKPTPQQALWLSKILNVSMEEIYLAKDKYIPTHYTLRQLAFEGDYAKIKAMSKDNNGKFDYSIAYDEYDKNIIAYLIEFKKINVIKEFLKEPLYHYEVLQHIEKLFLIALEYDDVELLQQLYCRTSLITILNEENKNVICINKELSLSKEYFKKILSCPNIINFLLNEKAWDDEEWHYGVFGAIFFDNINQPSIPLKTPEHNITKKLKEKALTISPTINMLLTVSVKEDCDEVTRLILEKGIKHNEFIKSLLEKYNYINCDFVISKSGQLCDKGRLVMPFPFVVVYADEEIKSQLKKKFESLYTQLNSTLKDLKKLGVGFFTEET